MTSRGPQEGNIMNFWEGDSEVKLHLALLSISEWKSNGKPPKSSTILTIIEINYQSPNHQGSESSSRSFSLSIPFKIPTIQHHPQNHQIEASSSKASKFQIDARKSSGYACNGLVISGIRCESPGTC